MHVAVAGGGCRFYFVDKSLKRKYAADKAAWQKLTLAKQFIIADASFFRYLGVKYFLFSNFFDCWRSI